MKRITLLAAAALAAAPALALAPARLEGGPFEPYRFNRATLRSESPLRGSVEIEGSRWDGSSLPLFRGEAAAATESLETAFYLDEEFRSLSVRASTVDGPLEFAVDISPRTGLGADVTPEEAELRRVMRALYPPPRGQARPFSAAPSLRLEGLSLQTAAFRAVGLFARPPRAILLAPLAAAALACSAAAALPRRKKARGRPAAIAALASAGAFALALCAAAPPAQLFRAVFPTRETGLELSGELERRVLRQYGCEIVEYGPNGGSREASAGSGSGATLLILPASGGIRLDAAAPAGSLARFSPPPLVYARDGELFAGGGSVSTGWTTDEGR